MQDLNEFISCIKRLGKVSIQDAHQQTEKLLYSNDDYYDDLGESNTHLKMYDLLDIVLASKPIGDAEDYYNYSILFAKINDYDAACEIIERGLLRTPKNVDLLALYVEYAPDNSDEQRFDKCQKHFSLLMSISRERWTWRAYDFSIDYLCKLIEQDGQNEQEIRKLINDLLAQYKTAFPLDERAYYAEYKYLNNFNETLEKQIDTLSKTLEIQAHSARCALRLAEIRFDRKEYSEAIELLCKASKDAVDMKANIDVANIFLLRFFAKATRLLEQSDGGKTLKSNTNKEEVLDTYRDFNLAKKLGTTNSRIRLANKHIKILEEYSGIENQNDFEE